MRFLRENSFQDRRAAVDGHRAKPGVERVGPAADGQRRRRRPRGLLRCFFLFLLCVFSNVECYPGSAISDFNSSA